MVKTVAFIDVVHVIPERPEKSFLMEKAAAPTAAWTKNFLSRVRPSSANSNSADGSAPGRFPISTDPSSPNGTDSPSPFAPGKNFFSRVRPSSSAGANAASASVNGSAPGRFPVSSDSSSSNGTDSTGPLSPALSGAEELTRDLQARARKFQKAAASSIGISKLNPRWAAPFLSSSSSSNSNSANTAQPEYPVMLETSTSSPAMTPAPISPPITPEQALLVAGNNTTPRAQSFPFFSQTHSHTNSLPVLHHPATPPQVDAPQMGQQQHFHQHGKRKAGPVSQAQDRALVPHEVEEVVAATNGNLSKGPVKSCLRPPSSMFFAELSMFVSLNANTPLATPGGGPSLPLTVIGADVSDATTAQALVDSAEGPAVRGLMTDRPWHRTEGPPVLSRLAAMNLARTPSPETTYPNGMAIPAPELSPSSPPAPSQSPPSDYLSVAMPIPRRTSSPNRLIGFGIARGPTPVNGREPLRTISPSNFGDAWHTLAGGLGSPGSAPATSPDQLLLVGPGGLGKQAGLQVTQIPLKAECACKDCHDRIINGISSSYTPTWTQNARNQYLANRAQEKKMREQGMDAEVRLALRGMQEATAKWLDRRDVHELTDEELAVLNLADFGGAMSEETHSEDVCSSSGQSHYSSAASSAHKPPSSREGSIRRLALAPILPARSSSISPTPRMASLTASSTGNDDTDSDSLDRDTDADLCHAAYASGPPSPQNVWNWQSCST
ncbi:hypothetical protein OC846_002234 [Tilletia horrida]|uniref:Uncharacterized protein n=1 Tax=Tilletia horrida TaxID=155126 RepID=A0AAN6GXF0_9BASI|nr:hypothetical protein OC845_003524 [Tilletia horrida]KAK0554145.1 hypothetical protein OC846_002234 [Tilletia horrida]KAK0568975.1 hypothetical protein OC861_001412 [Tilletia horrida]